MMTNRGVWSALRGWFAVLAILFASLFIPKSALAQTPPMPPRLPAPIAAPSQREMPSIWGSAMPDPPKRMVRRWYGWQTMIPLALMDIATVSSWVVALNDPANTPSPDADPYAPSPMNKTAFRFFQIAVIPVHTLAGPFVHWANDEGRTGAISLGLHMTMAYLTLFPLWYIGAVNDLPDETAPAVSVIGVLIANTIDIAILAQHKEPVPLGQSRGSRSSWPTSMAIVPMLNQQHQGVALVGQF
ncbi:MAG TPA: hypothetical protein PK156_36645 [Polyangium sp.]|nr:hypothetical protein [Polyangium sp.]